MWIVRDGAYYEYHFQRPTSELTTAGADASAGDPTVREADNSRPTVVRTVLLGANPTAEVVGQEILSYTCNYFIGNDPGKWRGADG